MTKLAFKTTWLYVGIVASQIIHSPEECLTGFYVWMSVVTRYFYEKSGIIPSNNFYLSMQEFC